MKNILLVFTILLAGLASFAQSPEMFKYQAVARNASGQILSNQNVSLQISILQGTSTGTAVYVETHSGTTNNFGLVNLEIGGGNFVSGSFVNINWAAGLYWVKVELDNMGGTNYSFYGVSQLLSVPYSLHSKTVEIDNVDDADHDPANEIQSLSINNNELSISNGNTVVLPSGTAGGAGYLSELNDVDTSGLSPGSVLVWNGTSWAASDICNLFSFYYADADNDGFGDPFNVVFACSAPSGYISDNSDCNDQNANINPSASEILDGLDNDCNGLIDDGPSSFVFYADTDGDGYGDPSNSISSATIQPGYVQDNTDCNDNDFYTHPNAPELCDNEDNDCDGLIDEGINLTTYYQDLDSDGYGNTAASIQSCQLVPGYVLNGGDCDDTDSNVRPGVAEIPGNNIDDNCNGQVDEGPSIFVFYADSDGDGYGDPSNSISSATIQPGYVQDNTDCNDNDFYTHPNAPELCDGADNNCDGLVDEGINLTTYYQDLDSDGFGNTAISVQSCQLVPGYVLNGGDCDDTDSNVRPGVAEIPGNNIDDNCNGQVDETTTAPNTCPNLPTVSDFNGNVYNTVLIGTQCWMGENLKSTHYSNGAALLHVSDDIQWGFLTNTDKAYCYYGNSTSNATAYGNLYTWAAAMNGSASNNSNPGTVQGICPTGWHLPGDNEWKQLEMSLGMTQVQADASSLRGTDEGDKLKETGNLHWNFPNTGANNSSGFTGLPGGLRSSSGFFALMGDYGIFWTATESSSNSAWARSLNNTSSQVGRNFDDQISGFSVRCVKD